VEAPVTEAKPAVAEVFTLATQVAIGKGTFDEATQVGCQWCALVLQVE
jgi:hypothetical protein